MDFPEGTLEQCKGLQGLRGCTMGSEKSVDYSSAPRRGKETLLPSFTLLSMGF